MAENVETQDAALQDDAPRPQKSAPWWVMALLPLLLCGALLGNYWFTTSGPPVAWVDGNLEAALAKVDDRHPRLFLYLFEPNDPSHARNEREIFTQRWAREPLQRAICIRLPLATASADSHRLRRQFNYNNKPLFLVLLGDGSVVSRAEGELDEREFETYIGKPVHHALRRSEGGGT